ncbi:hypothetical protein EV421DRAFT_2055117 [Armillaria borealis]|uniref:Peptidase C14 caspase domain-containing protein n=1 Tax=Armillaria borealis TaxID=47425 RepID=A0AA39JLY8_9AGAR|nr:hypothetical protein EV421DRAFT_2055117 [Armillaria borealis]
MQAKSMDLDGSRFWAVLIGVDAYPRYPLYGCVSDAELIEKYLVEDLGVPRDRIQRLLGPMGQKTADNSISPTRANITRTLYSLIDNPDIMRGDNIIIYFAGNGTLYDVEEYYRNRVPPEVSIAPIRSIKALCPMDHGASDDTGSEILDISDREIDAIVTQISQQKGHKITLILDCGYLRPSIRYACPLGIRRSLRIVVPLSRHTIEPMLEGAHQCLAAYPQYLARRSVAAYDWRPDRSSHVVLAACQEYQYAREAEDDAGIHGVFTKALMDALRSGQSRGTTYADLISKLPMWCFQTSLVTGDHKNEPIWYQE